MEPQEKDLDRGQNQHYQPRQSHTAKCRVRNIEIKEGEKKIRIHKLDLIQYTMYEIKMKISVTVEAICCTRYKPYLFRRFVMVADVVSCGIKFEKKKSLIVKSRYLLTDWPRQTAFESTVARQ